MNKQPKIKNTLDRRRLKRIADSRNEIWLDLVGQHRRAAREAERLDRKVKAAAAAALRARGDLADYDLVAGAQEGVGQ